MLLLRPQLSRRASLTAFVSTLGVLHISAQSPPDPFADLARQVQESNLLDSVSEAAQSAQTPASTSSGAETSASQATASGQAGAGTAASLQRPSGPTLFGTELPFLDPGSEVLSWNGQSWQVTNNRIFGARFEKYLSAPAAEAEEDKAYRDTLRQILDALSPHQEGKGSLTKAVALLPIAAAYYHDARLCESLSNTIYGIWLARRNISALQKTNQELERQAKRQLWNANISASNSPLRDGARSVNGGNNRRRDRDDDRDNDSDDDLGLSNMLGTQGLTSLGSLDTGQQASTARENFDAASWTAFYVKKMAEYETLAARNKINMAVSEIQQKIEFQGLILQYFMQRRFEHVVIATRLYRLLFKDGDSAMKLNESSAVYKSFMMGYGMTPTITTFDALANEAIRDVDEGVLAFEHLVAKGELEGATKRLSEAFAVGEYLPRIRTLSSDKKGRVLEFVRHSNQLLSAIDVKNYHLAEEIVEKMKALAKDFDYAKAEGLISATQMTAEMLLQKALLAARRGDEAEMQKNLEQAHALYPTNPKLKEVSDLIMRGSDQQSQALSDLDRLIAEGNFRAIQNDEARFVAAVGLSNDSSRMDALMEIRDGLKKLEMRLEKAKALSEAGNPEAAWETLHTGVDEFGKDPEFALLYSQLTVKAAQFVHMIQEASRHRSNEQYGSALSWYLKARQSYLKSELAQEGIDHLVEQMLPQG